MRNHLWWPLVFIFLFFHSAHAQVKSPAKATWATSVTTWAEAGKDTAVPNVGKTEIRSKSEGKEFNSCPRQASNDESKSSAYAKVDIVGIDHSTVQIQMAALASAKGGQYASCDRCPNEICLVQPTQKESAAVASSKSTATITYKFPRHFLETASKGHQLQVSALQEPPSSGRFKMSLKRNGPFETIPVTLGEPVYFTARPNESLLLSVSLEAVAQSSDATSNKREEEATTLQIELFEAPILEAAINEGYIIRGTPTTDYQAVGPLMIQGSDGKWSLNCTATVIGERYLLTAAHCVAPQNIQQAIASGTFYFIAATKAGKEVPIAIEKYNIPNKTAPDFFKFEQATDSTLRDDVAVLRTSTLIGISAIELAESNQALTRGQKVMIVGYGLDTDPNAEHDGRKGVKRKAEIGIVDLDSKTFFYSAQNGGSSTCNGDSGGPALVTNSGRTQLLGITSYGAGTCVNGKSMRVDTYRDWILRQMH